MQFQYIIIILMELFLLFVAFRCAADAARFDAGRAESRCCSTAASGALMLLYHAATMQSPYTKRSPSPYSHSHTHGILVFSRCALYLWATHIAHILYVESNSLPYSKANRSLESWVRMSLPQSRHRCRRHHLASISHSEPEQNYIRVDVT